MPRSNGYRNAHSRDDDGTQYEEEWSGELVQVRSAVRSSRTLRIDHPAVDRRTARGAVKEALHVVEAITLDISTGGAELARCVSHVFPSQCWHAGSVASQCGWPSIFLSHAPYVAR